MAWPMTDEEIAAGLEKAISEDSLHAVQKIYRDALAAEKKKDLIQNALVGSLPEAPG